MENQLDLLKFVKVGNGNGKETEADETTVVKTLHDEAEVHILKVVSQVEQYSGEKLQEPVPEIDIPECREFELGDLVKFKYETVEELESVLRRTTSWADYYESLLGVEGYVTKLSYGMGTNVAVRYPKRSFVAYVYSGVLEKVKEPTRLERLRVFKVGDIVSIGMESKMAVKLQKGLSNIYRWIFDRKDGDVKGKIIRFIFGNVLVGFSDYESFLIHPAVLKLETVEGFRYPSFINERFQRYEEVMVTSHIRELFKENELARDWNRNVSIIAGKKVFYLGQREKEFAVVCTGENGPSWELNVTTIYKEGERDPFDAADEEEDKEKMKDATMDPDQDDGKAKEEHETKGTDKDGKKQKLKYSEEKDVFMPEEPVKLKRIKNIRKILKKNSIPRNFLEYLQVPFKVISYNENKLFLNVRIHSNYFTLDSRLLEKLTDEEMKLYEIRHSRDFSVGDFVHLNVGPPNYVKKVLRKYKASDEVIHTLTTTAEVVGFVGDSDVVIEYPDEEGSIKTIKIHKRHLTDPKKFNLDKKDGFEVTDIFGVQKEFHDLLEKGKDMTFVVEKSTIVRGHHPTMIVKLSSAIAAANDVIKILKQAGIRVKKLSSEEVQLQGFKCYDGIVNVEFKFVPRKRMQMLTRAQMQKKAKTDESYQEEEELRISSDAALCSLKAEPIREAESCPASQSTPLPVRGTIAEVPDPQNAEWVRIIGGMVAFVRVQQPNIQMNENNQVITIINPTQHLQGQSGFNI